jgi:hypothetical protein
VMRFSVSKLIQGVNVFIAVQDARNGNSVII